MKTFPFAVFFACLLADSLLAAGPMAAGPMADGPLADCPLADRLLTEWGAQEPTPPVAAERREIEGPTAGSGRGASYRAALVNAIEDAVGKQLGTSVVRGPAMRSRLWVVANWNDALPEGWFDGESGLEREWVQQQIEGFVQRYEVTKKTKAADGQWEVTVLAQVTGAGDRDAVLVIDLADDDLRKWQLERFEQGGSGGPFDRLAGNYEAPRLAENLRASGVVRLLAKGQRVDATAAGAVDERGGTGRQLVASHRVTVVWQPMVFTSLVEKPNRARPTTGPRPQFLTSGSVRVNLTIVDVVQGLDLFDRRLSVDLELPPSTPVERLDALAVQLADKAKATVAELIVFALRPPVVTRKWAGESGEWLVEASVPRRVMQGYDAFAVGNFGSLASPDWRPIARATLVGGSDTTCTFQLLDVVDPSAIEAGVSEVRPTKK